jgi:arginyl-tRNA synthetase
MKNQIIDIIKNALIPLSKELGINLTEQKVVVTPTKQRDHGDYACNIALALAKPTKTNPRLLAEKIIKYINAPDLIQNMQIAGPGFINFFLNNSAQFSIINQIISEQDNYGNLNIGNDKKVNVEYVSANPTGPLHVGHGRGAAIGSVIANILKKAGYQVTSEYYVNDAGRQMDILATSVWLRYLEICGENFNFPSNGYKGEYIYTIARNIYDSEEKKYFIATDKIFDGIPADYSEDQVGDKEKHIDALIHNAKFLLNENYDLIHQIGLEYILNDIKSDLSDFKVEYDNWFSEKSLMTSNSVADAIKQLQDNGHIYNKNNALWFKSSDFGDEKDRCIVRDNGQSTYFASDAAYLRNKFRRGFDEVVYLFGADHHGYVPRLLALAQSFGYDINNIKIPLVQFASLFKDGQPIQMSTRSGSFVTLRQLREEVGTDAARFFYIMRKADQHLDFDLDLATSKSNENPVYYIQYAHARICSIYRQLQDKGLKFNQSIGLENLKLLDKEIEAEIANKLTSYTSVIKSSAEKLEPHLIANYLKELANLLHSYYNSERFILDNNDLMQARLVLLKAIKITITNALNLLGISAPEKM